MCASSFKSVLFCVLVGLVVCVSAAAGATAANQTPLPRYVETGYRVVYAPEYADSGVGTYVIGPTWPIAQVSVDHGSAYAAILYACNTKTFVAARCDVVADMSSDVASATFRTGRQWYIVVVTTPEIATFETILTIQGTHNQVSDATSGSGYLYWTKQVDLGVAGGDPCKIHNDAIAEFMDGRVMNGAVRFHHEGVDSLSIVAQTGFVDHGPTKSCFVVHPSTDSSVTYPDPYNAVTALATLDEATAVRIHYDEVVVEIDETGLTENAVVLDVGNGWGAGTDVFTGLSYGDIPGVRMTGFLGIRVSTQSAVGANTKVVPSPLVSSDLKYSQFGDTLVGAGFDRVSYTDASQLTVKMSELDQNDIGCHFMDSWGMRMPKCEVLRGKLKGVGLLFIGANNGFLRDSIVRHGAYNVVRGTPVLRGERGFYSSCASGFCATTVTGTIGPHILGAVYEGALHANYIEFAGRSESILRDMHTECASNGCFIGNIVLRPFLCDGTTGTHPGDAGVPVQMEEDIDCLDEAVDVFSITGVTDNGATATVTTDEAHGYGNVDVWIVNTGTSLDKTPLTITSTTATTFDVATDPEATVTGLIVAQVAETTVPPTSAVAPGPPGQKSSLTFSGNVIGQGGDHDTDYAYRPAILLGEDFHGENTVLFTDGVVLGRDRTTNEIFTIHPALTRASKSGTDRFTTVREGRIDTSGAVSSGNVAAWPGGFDGWVDSRESLLTSFRFTNTEAAWNTDKGSGLEECVNASYTNFPSTTVGVVCSNQTARLYPASTDVYVTRLQAMALGSVNGTEGCDLLLSDDEFVTDMTISIPPMSGTNFLGNTSAHNFVYPVGMLVADDERFQIAIVNGTHSGSGTPACTGNFEVQINVFGFRNPDNNF